MAEEVRYPTQELVAEALTLVEHWEFRETLLENGITAYAKPVFGKNANLNSLVFLFPFATTTHNSIMMEIVAYFPLTIPDKDRSRVAEFIARTGTSTVSFMQLDMDVGIVSMKQRVLFKDHIFSRDFLAVVADILFFEADAIIPVLNKLVYSNLKPRDAIAELDAVLGYTGR